MCEEKKTNVQKCPDCDSVNAEDQGHRFGSGSSKAGWKNETWKCKDCGKKFVIKKG